ncbi:RICIN domain-containing protein [Catellatospora chokoriensis]|uniref:Ricin B lectin domain-containing protein n=1 Tax=Catellatospora chokoriensis TaxID=310353 RepID=A0A8J3NUJ7_9ACTN|nr:RICIN domain-containing protein [Catellatospora chokoriensis]GIF92861.1 hypothetical protein Cch02nite_63050 [Catellatospora chokoriensis]
MSTVSVAAFDADRAVEVISRGAPAGVADGYQSGYYLGSGLVLTCAHALSDAPGVELTVRDISRRTVTARIAWFHRHHDLALLAADDHGHLPAETVSLSVLPRITTDTSARFVMYGWPRAGQLGTKRNPVQVHGPVKFAEVAGATTGTMLLRPDLNCPPGYWKGMSGAAVFCDGHLIAVQLLQPDPKLDYLVGLLLTEDMLMRPDERGRRGSDILTAAGVAWGITATGMDRPTSTAPPPPASLSRRAADSTDQTAERERPRATASRPAAVVGAGAQPDREVDRNRRAVRVPPLLRRGILLTLPVIVAGAIMAVTLMPDSSTPPDTKGPPASPSPSGPPSPSPATRASRTPTVKPSRSGAAKATAFKPGSVSRIRNASIGQCVSGEDFSPGYGPCSSSHAYEWTFRDTGGGTFELVNRASGKCLEAPYTENSGAGLAHCSGLGGTGYSHWRIESTTDRGQTLQNTDTGQCLAIASAPYGGGKAVMLTTCDSDQPVQLWRNSG